MPFIVWMLSCYGMHIGERKNGMCVMFCRMWVKSIMFGRIRYTIFCRMCGLYGFYAKGKSAPIYAFCFFTFYLTMLYSLNKTLTLQT